MKTNINTEIENAIEKYFDNVDSGWNYIAPPELKKELEEGKDYFILDTRKPEDFKKGHLKGSKNIFWKDLKKKENRKKLPKNKEIVIVCYVGHTASQVMVILQLLDYKARTLKFGMGESPVVGVPVAGWKNYGFDVVKS